MDYNLDFLQHWCFISPFNFFDFLLQICITQQFSIFDRICALTCVLIAKYRSLTHPWVGHTQLLVHHSHNKSCSYNYIQNNKDLSCTQIHHATDLKLVCILYHLLQAIHAGSRCIRYHYIMGRYNHIDTYQNLKPWFTLSYLYVSLPNKSYPYNHI